MTYARNPKTQRRPFMKRLALFIFATMAGQMALSAQCPNSIQVIVKELKSTSSTNTAAIQRIFIKGDSQTDKAYIKEILESVNKIDSVNDTLVQVKSQSKTGHCVYRGSTSSLILTGGQYYSDKPVANLRIGRVNYKGSNPSQAWGYQASLKTELSSFNELKIVQAGKAVNLVIDLMVQIPLGDYGTDGYDVDAKIGQAKSIEFKVLN